MITRVDTVGVVARPPLIRAKPSRSYSPMARGVVGAHLQQHVRGPASARAVDQSASSSATPRRDPG